jgi:hypothetical protein
MRWHIPITMALSTGSVLLCAPALAQTTTMRERCRADCLDATRARERTEWGRTCGLARNVGDPSTPLLINADEVSMGMPAMYDHDEVDQNKNWRGQNAYSGAAYGFRINEAYVSSLYESTGIITQSRDANGYYKWVKSSSQLKPVPHYPSFGSTGSIYDSGNKLLYRNPNNPSDCNLYNDTAATSPASAFFVNGYCDPSCASQFAASSVQEAQAPSSHQVSPALPKSQESTERATPTDDPTPTSSRTPLLDDNSMKGQTR